MRRFTKRFAKSTAGAITIDWVVLCAAVIILSVMVGGSISESVTGLAGDVSVEVEAAAPANLNLNGG